MRGLTPLRPARLLAGLVIACAAGLAAPAWAGDDLLIEGVAGLAQRIALPSKTQLVVEVAPAGDGRPLAERRIDLDGRQPPVPFTLTIGRDRLAGAPALALRAAFLVEGQARFVSDPQPLDLKAERIAVGELVLRPYQALAFVTTLTCGPRTARLGLSGGTLVLEMDGARHALRRGPDAREDGAYVGIDSPLALRIEDKSAILTLADGTRLDCRAAAEPGPTLAARGNEPFWRLTLGPKGVELASPTPDLAFSAPSVTRDATSGAPRFTATAGSRRLAVGVSEKPCADSMTGMPFPVGVTVEIDGRRLEGCGGEIADLLAGGWRVIRLGDDPVPAGAALTLSFGADAQVSGSSGCNRFSGSYQLSGEGLSFGPLAGTRMACPPAQMELEARMLGLLAKVTRATTGENGQIRLMAQETQALVLDRAH